MTRTPRSRVLLLLAVSAASVAWLFRFDGAHADEPAAHGVSSQSSSSAAKQDPETVTIEAQREKELKSQISRFVASVLVSYLNDSLARWDSPICPLVAGLPADRGEFILARVSQIARNSHAPLAGEHCRANFFVVVAANPQLLIKRWSKRDKELLNTCNGLGSVNDFIRSKAPVRVWYNTDFRYNAGVTPGSDASQLELVGLTLNFMLSPCATTGMEIGTRLRFNAVQSLTSVIVVVDSARIAGINLGQLADYIAMAGFAQIRLDANTGTAPTILSLFRGTEQPPQGLSPWDESFLHSLYTTNQNSVMQVSAIKLGMFEQIGR